MDCLLNGKKIIQGLISLLTLTSIIKGIKKKTKLKPFKPNDSGKLEKELEIIFQVHEFNSQWKKIRSRDLKTNFSERKKF